jgi:hypothetical protein
MNPFSSQPDALVQAAVSVLSEATETLSFVEIPEKGKPLYGFFEVPSLKPKLVWRTDPKLSVNRSFGTIEDFESLPKHYNPEGVKDLKPGDSLVFKGAGRALKIVRYTQKQIDDIVSWMKDARSGALGRPETSQDEKLFGYNIHPQLMNKKEPFRFPPGTDVKLSRYND